MNYSSKFFYAARHINDTTVLHKVTLSTVKLGHTAKLTAAILNNC